MTCQFAQVDSCSGGLSGGGEFNGLANKGRYAMLKRCRAGIVTALVVAPAVGGWFGTGFRAEEGQQIKRFAIVSSLGDEIHGRLFGLTRFQDKSFDASIPGWHLDATVTKDLAEQIVAGGKIKGEVVAVSMASSKKSEILSEARSQGFDAVLVVIAEPSVPDRALVGGVMLVRQKKLGNDRLNPCAGILVRVFQLTHRNHIDFT